MSPIKIFFHFFIFKFAIIAVLGAYLQENGLESMSSDYGCICGDYTCGCCAHLEVSKVGLNDTGCVNLTYLPNEYGIAFTVTIDNLTIYNETISAKNPPPICFGAPVLKEYADLCVRFYDVDVTRTKLHGCVRLEARLHHVAVATYNVGCFHLGKSRWRTYHARLVDKILKMQGVVRDAVQLNSLP